MVVKDAGSGVRGAACELCDFLLQHSEPESCGVVRASPLVGCENP